MFSRISRYRKLPDVTVTDAHGRTVTAKALRPLPQASGTFTHSVHEGDRLDHLAYQYYRQANKWWRISDANPQFLAPRALLGKESLDIARFPLTWSGTNSQAPWTTLTRNLGKRIGVEQVRIIEESRLMPEIQLHNGKPVTVHVERLERAVIITYNQLNVSPGDLTAIIAAAGFGVGQPERLERVGQQIIIPSDSIA